MMWVSVTAGVAFGGYLCWLCWRLGYRQGHTDGYLESIADELRVGP